MKYFLLYVNTGRLLNIFELCSQSNFFSFVAKVIAIKTDQDLKFDKNFP